MKFETIEAAQIPEETRLTDAAKEKLAAIKSLTPGKALKVAVAKGEMRGFKASMTRLAKRHDIAIVCTSDEAHVYIQLASE